MSDINVNFNEEEFMKNEKRFFFLNGLEKALWNYCKNKYGDNVYNVLNEEIEYACGKSIEEISCKEELFCKKFVEAISKLCGKDSSKDVEILCDIITRGQFNSSMLRRSLRSGNFGYYTARVLDTIVDYIKFPYYGLQVEELLKVNSYFYISSFSDFIALEISKNNTNCIDVLREMILGDNNVMMKRDAIIGIIKSNNAELKDLLKKMLLAAGSQEGLRQAVLESIDSGDRETFVDFFKFSVDNDLFRFSSAIRAFFTWTGIAPSDMSKLNVSKIKKLVDIACNCLLDPVKRAECMDSDNPMEIFFALWSIGCDDVEKSIDLAVRMTHDEKKHKRLIGNYFTLNVGSATYKHKIAVTNLDETDDEVLAYVVACLHHNSDASYAFIYNRTENKFAKPRIDRMYPNSFEERYALFTKIKSIAVRIGKKTMTFEHSIFDWNSISLSNKDGKLFKVLISIAAYDLNEKMIDELWEIRDFIGVDERCAIYANLLNPERNAKHRDYLYEALSDRSSTNKEAVLKLLSWCDTTDSDIDHICELLKSKSSRLKVSLMKYLTKLDQGLRKKAARTLIKGEEYQIQAALELAIADDNICNEIKEDIEKLSDMKLSTQTKVLFDQLNVGTSGNSVLEGSNNGESLTNVISPENGYGLYDIKKVEDNLEEICKSREKIEIFPKKSFKRIFLSKAEILTVMDKIDEIIESHKDFEYEYEDWSGTRRTILFGDAAGYYAELQIPAEYGPKSKYNREGKCYFNYIPFHEEFYEVLKPYIINPLKMAMLCYLIEAARSSEYEYGAVTDEAKAFLDEYCPYYDSEYRVRYKARLGQIIQIIEQGRLLADENQLWEKNLKLYFSLIDIIGVGRLGENISKETKQYFGERYKSWLSLYPFSYLRKEINRKDVNSQQFKLWFNNEYSVEGISKAGSYMSLSDYFYAISLNIIDEDTAYKYVFDDGLKCISHLTYRKNKSIGKVAEYYPGVYEFIDKLIKNTITLESRRGQAETSITRCIHEIRYFEGIGYFVMLLCGLGKENFTRGYFYSSETAKNSVLSSLLKRCYPANGDNAEKLRELIKDTDITAKRLIEAAMYAPQWADIIEDYTKIDGLKKGIWFFHAHISERFDEEKEGIVALYSPISPKKFNDGVFDIDWFEEVLNQLGEKRFNELYKSAKYITSGSNAHRRSQMYTDAVRGKLNADELEKEIMDKRNQEKLRTYALIPFEPTDDDTLLKRYEFIMEFKKGSKNYGAQRRESEKLAVNIALENLALTAKIFDINRMMWRLEAKKSDEILSLLEKKEVEGVFFNLSIDDEGNCSLCIEKNGKSQKSVPKALAKNEYVLMLKEKAKEMKDQKQRAKETFEQCMVNRTKLGIADIKCVTRSKVLYSLAKNLVWIADTKGSRRIGFIFSKDDAIFIKDIEGNEYAIDMNDNEAVFYVAHAIDLKNEECWSLYMHYVYENEIVQPFKQVFREVYPITQEELNEKNISRRYAGFQIQANKAVAVLRSRGWIASYEQGLEKVNYIQDVYVTLYADMDFFTPADVESPTLEYVSFYSRKTDKAIDLKDIDEVLFSETMRDLDLMVSTSYVGGVDPESSHSTVEMRIAIAKELTGMQSLSNV
ncbi:DUF4132 domain-containing protein [Butyrivibrio sp. NC3005]|uniref:DUF4132 domain-containing protein n=1 Tax=Butyrivibrio sp. NC3005 TaxID=1280685 RepID=UPI00041EBC0A|nr:DUF4132 domain-containing protein [Butyrivibrio sp. NC3005]